MRKTAFLSTLVAAALSITVFGGTALAGDPRLETTVQAPSRVMPWCPDQEIPTAPGK